MIKKLTISLATTTNIFVKGQGSDHYTIRACKTNDIIVKIRLYNNQNI